MAILVLINQEIVNTFKEYHHTKNTENKNSRCIVCQLTIISTRYSIKIVQYTWTSNMAMITRPVVANKSLRSGREHPDKDVGTCIESLEANSRNIMAVSSSGRMNFSKKVEQYDLQSNMKTRNQQFREKNILLVVCCSFIILIFTIMILLYIFSQP